MGLQNLPSAWCTTFVSVSLSSDILLLSFLLLALVASLFCVHLASIQSFVTVAFMSTISSSTSTVDDAMEKGSPPDSTVKDNICDAGPRSFSAARKALVVGIVSWIGFCATFGSSSLFPATDMILQDLSTSQYLLDISNAMTLICMGCSAFVWTPVSSIIGTRRTYHMGTFLLMGFCIGVAVAPNMQIFMLMRLAAGFEGTWFLIGAQEAIARMFVPTQRGTAVGFFLAGTVIGPALGPCIGGIIVTYTSWRVIFWVQAGMTAVGFILAIFLLPDLEVDMRNNFGKSTKIDLASFAKEFNPWPVLKTLLIWRVCLNNLTCASLSWAQYFLLVSPHLVLNKALNLDTPILGGLFYLAPGCGFLVGTTIGGYYADIITKRYIAHRGGQRRPEDRLNAALIVLLLLAPGSFLIYGWTAQYKLTGIILPATSAFLAGFGVMSAFASLNTYAIECVPHCRQQAMIGKYVIQCGFSAAASGATTPLINNLGVGFTTTISAVMVAAGGLLTLMLSKGMFKQQKTSEYIIKP